MALSKAQIADKEKFSRWFWLWERDLLYLAHRWCRWRRLANELGFDDDKIDEVWTHSDAGRHIKYMQNPFYEVTPDA